MTISQNTPEGGVSLMAPKLSHVIRLDSIPLQQTYFTPEGYLKDRPILTTTGIFEYINPDGSVRRELRLPEEVFDPESLVTYKGKPVIITHDAGLITKENVHQEQIGTILSEGYRDGCNVRAEIIIHDTDEMKDCGLKELSLGYNLDLDETPGVWEGQPYDAVQRNIRINHLALVREARAGETARLNIDSRDSNILKGGKASMSKKKVKKTTRRADGVLGQEELKKAIEEYKARRAQRMAAKADEEETEQVVATQPETVVDEEVAAVAEPTVGEAGTVEEQVQMVKDRRDRRDSEGEPATTEEAIGVIANQDEDIDILFDIIDTLLAEKAFDEAEGEENTTETENADEGEEETAPAEEEEVAADEDEEEPAPEATDDDDETAVDEGEEETENLDEDDDEIPSTSAPGATGTINADSVDRIVRTRIQLGMIGRTLHMDGLESMGIMAAKKKIIAAVRPGLRLDGKSTTYINAAYDLAVQEVKKASRKDTAYQKRQMFNGDSRSTAKSIAKGSAASARERMIARHQKLSKEDK